jgi:cytochrome c biogenesis protein CcdA
MQFGDVVLRISESVSFPLLSAFLIGILASVSPCPLATNITAMAYISRNITDKRYVVTSGILYTLGRTVSYFTIGALIILAGMKIPHVAETLQDAGEKFLGPLLLIVGIIMLDIVKLPVPASFAIGTGLPVLLFGILLSAGITQVSRWLNIVTASERVIRKIAALVFIGAGVYYIVLWIQG